MHQVLDAVTCPLDPPAEPCSYEYLVSLGRSYSTLYILLAYQVCYLSWSGLKYILAGYSRFSP